MGGFIVGYIEVGLNPCTRYFARIGSDPRTDARFTVHRSPHNDDDDDDDDDALRASLDLDDV